MAATRWRTARCPANTLWLMPERLNEYFISLDVLATEAQRLEDATGVKWDGRVGGVITKEPSDGSAYVVFQVRAGDEDAAYADALEAYEILRSDAGLDPAPPLAGRVRGAPPGAGRDCRARGAASCSAPSGARSPAASPRALATEGP